MKSKIFLIAAIASALLAAGSVYWYLANLETTYRVGQTFAKVLVALETIPSRSQVKSFQVTVEELPVSYIIPDAYRSMEEVVGKTATTTIYAGEQLLASRLASPGDLNQGLSFRVAKGKRGVAVAVNEVVGVAGFLVPGDRVDVVVEMEKRDGKAFSRLLLQDIRVLAVGPFLERPDPKQPVKELTSTVLEVSPEEALALVIATEEGRVRILLRPAIEEERVNLTPYSVDRLEGS